MGLVKHDQVEPATAEDVAEMATDKTHRRVSKQVNYDRGLEAGRAGERRLYNCRAQYRPFYEAGYLLGLSERSDG